jgi:4-hydroxybenzoate polyprenyltransferase
MPYAVCFGLLSVVVSLAASGHDAAPAWMPAAGALLGVGAHLINAVPDLEADRATGIRGCHTGWARVVRSTLRSVITVLAACDVGVAGISTLAIVAFLAVAGRIGPRQAAFRAALAIAFVDVVALVLRS